MARTEITVTDMSFQEGLTFTGEAADSANGMMYENDGNTFLFIENADASSIDIEITSVADEAGREENLDFAIAGNSSATFSVLRERWFNQTSSDVGKVYIDFSADTSVTVQAFRFRL